MDTVEVRRRFAAYGAGEIPADDLRVTIRDSLGQNPLLASAYVALAEAYRRANVIDAGLQSVINADIAEVTGPRFAKTRIRPAAPAADPRQSHTVIRAPAESNSATQYRRVPSAPRDPTGWLQPPPAAAAGTEDYYAPRSGHTGFQQMPDSPVGLTGVQTTGRTTSGTNGSAWDSVERLTEVAEPLFPGSVLRERFELTDELGRGGMGVVFKAYDRTRAELRDPFVAIKVLNEDFKRHPLAVRALQREARKAQKLAHPNIVTVYDFDRDRGNVYMVMEYLSGRSLDQVINGEARSGMSVKRVLEIVRSLAAALTYAHEQDIVHSDLKPSNTFITDDNRIKVLDFGIARAAPSQVERGEKTIFDAGQLGAISPAYASLEMLQGAQPDPRDDIYALACVTYELLTGHHPFNRIDAAKAFAQKLQPAPVKSLSRAQWQGLRRGLAFERNSRTPTVAEFVRDLTQKSRRPVMWKALAASIVLVGLAVGGTQLALWQYHALQRRIVSADDSNFPQVLSDLHRYPQVFLDWVLADDSTAASFTGHFRTLTAQQIESGDYGNAEKMLRELRAFMPGTPVATELSQRLDQQKAQQVKELLAQREQALARGTLVASQGELNVTDLTRRMLVLEPGNRALLDQQTAGAYDRGASSALDNNQQDLAKELVGSGLYLFPDDENLRGLQARLGGVAAEPGQPAGAAEGAQLADLLEHPAPTQAWESALKAQLVRLPPGDERLANANSIGAHTFVLAATDARKGKDYVRAKDLLANAESFDPQSPEVKAESDAFNREQGKGDTRTAGNGARTSDQTQTLKNQITADELKNKLFDQAFAGDIVGANTTAEQLAKVIPGSVYLTRDVPTYLANAYANLARREFAEGRVNAALQTLQGGRRKLPRSEDLATLQEHYTSASDFYDTLANAVSLGNVSQKKQVLQQLKVQQGEDYDATEKMFAQTLANRIADQRAAERPTVAASLLSSGRELFPTYAGLLTQGTAGILGNDTGPAGALASSGAAAPEGVAGTAARSPAPAAAAGQQSPSAAASELGTPAETGPAVVRTASSAGEAPAPAIKRTTAVPEDVRTSGQATGPQATASPDGGVQTPASAPSASAPAAVISAPPPGSSDAPAAAPPQQ